MELKQEGLRRENNLKPQEVSVRVTKIDEKSYLLGKAIKRSKYRRVDQSQRVYLASTSWQIKAWEIL